MPRGLPKVDEHPVQSVAIGQTGRPMRNNIFGPLAGIAGQIHKIVGKEQTLFEKVVILIVQGQPHVGGCVRADGFFESVGRISLLIPEEHKAHHPLPSVAKIRNGIAPESVELQSDRFLQILPDHQDTISNRCADFTIANTNGLGLYVVLDWYDAKLARLRDGQCR